MTIETPRNSKTGNPMGPEMLAGLERVRAEIQAMSPTDLHRVLIEHPEGELSRRLACAINDVPFGA